MNRLFLLIYVLVLPVAILALLFELGVTHLWYGLPLQWVLGCVPIENIYGGCGIVADWSLFWLDALFYTALGYFLFLVYYRLRSGKGKTRPSPQPSNPSAGTGWSSLKEIT